MYRVLLLILLVFIGNKTNAQDYYLPINKEINLKYEVILNKVNSDAHTAFKPLRNIFIEAFADIDSLDSVYAKPTKFNKTYFGRKLRFENLIEISNDDYKFIINPLFDFSIAKEKDINNNLITNTRGLWIKGSIGDRFSFHSQLSENQIEYPSYIDSTIQIKRVVPGFGRVKRFKTGAYDFANSSASISYSLKKYFNFQFGHDKNFIGDGYRSLLLSDNAYNYTFFKITTNIWKIKYTNLYMFMQDYTRDFPDQLLFRKKYGSLHYLDINIGKRLSVGIMENVIWRNDSVSERDFEIHYLNPVIFFRPLEYTIGSPDNVLLGFNLKYKLSNSTTTYGQFMLDDFNVSEFKAKSKFYGNKYAYQIGLKSSDVFNISNLFLLTEFNLVRPYTYSHTSSLQNYAHFYQSLAHPLGANFWEWMNIINYKYQRLSFEGKFMYAKIGYDTAGVNYGQNIFLNYLTRANEYGVELLQGDQRSILFLGLKTAYVINPKTNMRAELEINSRTSEGERTLKEDLIISFGFKTNIFNTYHDF